MKPFNLPLLIAFLLPTLAFAQSTDQEIDKIAGQLVSALNNNRKVKAVGVANFTYRGNAQTAIGRYLANELTLGMSMRGPQFDLIPREVVAERLYGSRDAVKPDLGAIGGSAKEAILKEDHETETDQQGDIIDAGKVVLQELVKLKGNGWKNSDALVSGVIEDKGDEIRLIITVNLRESIIGGARGNFIKTPDIRDKMEEQVVVATTTYPKGPVPRSVQPPTSGSANVEPFRLENMVFEVTGCHQSARTIECNLNIVSDKDTELQTYCTNSRVIDASNSHEFHAIEVKLADVSSTNYARKSMVSNIPIQGLIRFGNVDQKVVTIAKMEIQFHTKPTYYATATLYNVPVR
jgi:hypothetical protein